jgi:hypothetical protein
MPARPAWNAHRILLAEFVRRQELRSKGETKTISQWILMKYVLRCAVVGNVSGMFQME